MTSVDIVCLDEPKKTKQKETVKEKRCITHRNKPSFGMKLAGMKRTKEFKEEQAIVKKQKIAQDELQESASGLLVKCGGRFTKNAGHKDRFQKELDSSKAIPLLLGEYTGWVDQLPAALQIVALVGEKYLKTILHLRPLKHLTFFHTPSPLFFLKKKD